MTKSIKIGNASGYWGDDGQAFARQIQGGDLDYLTFDYLAEITMSILKKQMLKKPELGFVPDFLQLLTPLLKEITQKGVKLVTNAGGLNPIKLGELVHQLAVQQNIPLKVAVINGDNIVDNIGSLSSDNPFEHLETGAKFDTVKDKIAAANIYLGVSPIVKALQMGAQIIITGRTTDTALVLAPMVYEFGWAMDDYNKLASGIVAGHILECGPQATGGNFTDWSKVPSWDTMGYPIVDMQDDGDFTVYKHDNTGGLISIDTLREQLVYEVKDPNAYLTPDVSADFTTINLENAGENKVKVTGVKGNPPPDKYKVSMAYANGFQCHGTLIISKPDALKKAKEFDKILWNRLGETFEKTSTEYVGFNSCQPDVLPEKDSEILFRVGVYDNDRAKVMRFIRKMFTLGLSGPGGIASMGLGLPPIHTVVAYWPTLINRKDVKGQVQIADSTKPSEGFCDPIIVEDQCRNISKTDEAPHSYEKVKVELLTVNPMGTTKIISLREIALGRSGDKGNIANVGILARNDKQYVWLRDNLTPEFVKEQFKSIAKGKITRYDMPNMLGFNFILEEALDGGGTMSLRIDTQGKTLAQTLLSVEVEIDNAYL